MDEKQRESMRRWYLNLSEEQRDKRRTQQREYRRRLRAEVPEVVREQKRLWQLQNRERLNAERREKWLEKRDRINAERREKYGAEKKAQKPAEPYRDKLRRQARESYQRTHKYRTWKRYETFFTREHFEQVYQQLLHGPCDICGVMANGKTMDIDHCHNAMKFRGVLCHGCNKGLGDFQDDVSRLRGAIAYLERSVNSEIR